MYRDFTKVNGNNFCISIFCSSLQAGGAERALSIIANELVNHSTVFLNTFEKIGSEPFYKLNDKINLNYLHLREANNFLYKKITSNVKAIYKIRQVLARQKPDIIISFINRVNVKVALANKMCGYRLVLVEQNNPYHDNIEKIWDLARRLSYNYADALVVLTPDVVKFFESWFRGIINVIPNPLDDVEIKKQLGGEMGKEQDLMIAVGRLVSQKNYKDMIQAFYMFWQNNRSWKLEIWGAGEEYSFIKNSISEFGLDEFIQLKGITKTPFKEMSKAQIFLLTSNYEGFGNVIAESLASGTPVISYDCESGPSYIIDNNINGILVPYGNLNKFVSAMNLVAKNNNYRKKLTADTGKVWNKFGKNKIMSKWINLINEVCCKNTE